MLAILTAVLYFIAVNNVAAQNAIAGNEKKLISTFYCVLKQYVLKFKLSGDSLAPFVLDIYEGVL